MSMARSVARALPLLAVLVVSSEAEERRLRGAGAEKESLGAWLIAERSRDQASTLLEEADSVRVRTTHVNDNVTTGGLVHATTPLTFAYLKVVDMKQTQEDHRVVEGLTKGGCLGLRSWIETRMGGPQELRRVAVDGESPVTWEAFWATYGAEARMPEEASVLVDVQAERYSGRKGVRHGPTVVTCALEIPSLEGRTVSWVHARKRRFSAAIPPIFNMEKTKWEWVLSWIAYHAAQGLDTLHFYTGGNHVSGATDLGVDMQLAVAEAAERHGVEIVHTDFSGVISSGVSMHYHGQRESAHDGSLWAQAHGAEWVLFCDLDEFLAVFPEHLASTDADTTEALPEAVRIATERSGEGKTPSIITFGAWNADVGECVGEENMLSVDQHARARESYQTHEKEARTDAAAAATMLLDQAAALTALVHGDAFERNAGPVCNLAEKKLIKGGSDMLCVHKGETLAQGEGHRKYMARPGEIAALGVHYARMTRRPDMQPVHIPSDEVHMLHLRGAQFLDRAKICQSREPTKEPYSGYMQARKHRVQKLYG